MCSGPLLICKCGTLSVSILHGYCDSMYTNMSRVLDHMPPVTVHIYKKIIDVMNLVVCKISAFFYRRIEH